MTGPSLTVRPPELARRTSRLTLLYVTALSSVALLTILGQILVQWSLSQQTSDSAVVNVAGRQRMLSQKLAKAAIGFQHARSPFERQQRRDEIRATSALWRRAHEGLLKGDSVLNLPGRRTAEVDRLFAELDPAYRAIQSAAEQLLVGDAQTVGPSSDGSGEAVATILANESEFLAGMDAIVAQYEREARGRVNRLQTIERILLAVTLIVLVCEGVLVFRPAVEHVRLAASELLKSRQQLEIAKEAAESANRQKTQFLANISHELRNPLHAVLGNLELLDRTQLNGRQRGYVTTADDSARTLEQLLSDLLDMSRIESGHLAIHCAPFSLRDLAERCLAMHRSQAEERGLQLRGEMGDIDLWLLGDALRLRQIVTNLLSNALKFTEEGEVQLRVSALRETETDSVARIRLEVSDTGIGISPEQQARIFEAFVQVDASSRREYGGAGLGLAITSRLVVLMGGTCSVVSELGSGSTFWVELPLQLTDAPSQSGKVQPVGAGVDESDPYQPRLNVLVVDDDEVNRRLIVDSLTILGHPSMSAADGPTAFARANKFSPDVVLLDLHLPGMDGYEVARRIRALRPEMGWRPAIIAVSAASDLMQAQSEEGLFDLVLSKPAGVRQIENALRIASFKKDGSITQHSQTRHAGGDVSDQDSALGNRWLTVLQRLQGRQELFCGLARLFLEGLPEQCAELEAALSEHRMEAVVRGAHTLRGQAVLFAADDLATALLKLEHHAGSGDYDTCNHDLEEAVGSANRLADELRAVLPQMEACAALE